MLEALAFKIKLHKYSWVDESDVGTISWTEDESQWVRWCCCWCCWWCCNTTLCDSVWGGGESTVGWVESGHSHHHHHCSQVSDKTSSSCYHRKYVDQVWWRIWCRPRLKLKICVLEIFGSEISVRTAFAYNQYLMNIQYHLNSTW